MKVLNILLYKVLKMFFTIRNTLYTIQRKEKSTFVPWGSPRRLNRFLFSNFFLKLIMSWILIFECSLAWTRSSFAWDWSLTTWDWKDELWISSVIWSSSWFKAAKGTIIWETLLEIFDLTISSLARTGRSSLVSDTSSSLANSLTKQI